MSNNTQTIELNVDLGFTINVDLTEFNSRTLKVDEIQDAKFDYIKNKIPSNEIKTIIDETVQKLEALGYKNIRNITCSEEPNPLSSLRRLLLNSDSIKDALSELKNNQV